MKAFDIFYLGLCMSIMLYSYFNPKVVQLEDLEQDLEWLRGLTFHDN